MKNALVYAADEREFAIALFAAERAARLSPDREFDILITSLVPLEIPPEQAALGIRNVVLDVGDDLMAANFKLDWLPVVTYLRLWLPGVFAGTYGRLLYMDGDTVFVQTGIEQLFNIDLGGHVLGAVLDKEQWVFQGRPVLDWKALGLDQDRYFNSGVQLIDVAAFNDQSILQKCLEIHHSGTPTQFHDQSLLNLALKGNFAELSPRWNWQWTHRFPALTRFADPFVLHFGGPPKPWQAHLESTRFPAKIVEDYAEHLTRLNAPLAFQTDRPGGLRASLYRRVKNFIGHYEIILTFRRLMRRVPDPFKARF